MSNEKEIAGEMNEEFLASLESQFPGAGELVSQVQDEVDSMDKGIKATLSKFTFGFTDKVYNMFTSPSMVMYERMLFDTSKQEGKRALATVMRRLLFNSLASAPVPSFFQPSQKWLVSSKVGRNIVTFALAAAANALLLPRAALLVEKAQDTEDESARNKYMRLAKTAKVVSEVFAIMQTHELGAAFSLDKAMECGLSWIDGLFSKHGEELDKIVNDISDKEIIDVTAQVRESGGTNSRSFPTKKKHRR